MLMTAFPVVPKYTFTNGDMHARCYTVLVHYKTYGESVLTTDPLYIKIDVEGKLRTGRYKDKKSGEWIYTTELVIDRHEFAEAKEKNDAMRKALAFEDDDSSVVDITYPEDFEDFE